MHEFPDNIFDLAFLSGHKEGFPDLADLAENEDWNYQNTTSNSSNPILTNFIAYTYKRLVEENKIVVSRDGQHLCFNTGLVTENQEDIFSYFGVNKKGEQPWYLIEWKKASDNDLASFTKLPDLASYYDDPSALLFDVRKELRANVDHIIEDNKERFPESVRSMQPFALRNMLQGALDAVKVRVRRNYKTAIPQYYRGRMQILLPVCLSNPRVADLALAVEDCGDHYRASTCLTLDMAYNNARQLARPDKDWLQP